MTVILARLPALGLLLILTACGDEPAETQAPAPPPAVTVITVTPQPFRPFRTFTGRVAAKDKVDLRARVEGFLEQRLFTEGQDVKTGDLLFTIEKAPYQAVIDQTRATIAKAEASLKLADVEVVRQTDLVKKQVGAQAKLDEATANQGVARAEVMEGKANLRQAELNLGYTDIRAPMAGRIGRTPFSVGDLVGPASDPLATIVSQDPIYVTFPVSQREILDIRKQHQGHEESPDVASSRAVIRLRLADGSLYGHDGKIDFVDVTVAEGTDTVTVRAVFPNPGRVLVDGQLVTVIGETGEAETVLMVPQQALQVDQSGPFVLTVDGGDKVQVRRIETGPAHNAAIVVTKGLEAGERVITEGIQKVRPGQTVAASEAPPAAEAKGGG